MSSGLPKGAGHKNQFGDLNCVNSLASSSTNVAKMRRQFEKCSDFPSEDDHKAEAIPVRPLRRNQRLKSTNKVPRNGDANYTTTLISNKCDTSSSSAEIQASNKLGASEDANPSGAVKTVNQPSPSTNSSSSNEVPSVAERKKIFQTNFLQFENSKKPNISLNKPSAKPPRAQPHRFVQNAERLANPLGNVQLEQDGVSPIVGSKPPRPVSTSAVNPPLKPPRTFAHEMYISQKQLNPCNGDKCPTKNSEQVPNHLDKSVAPDTTKKPTRTKEDGPLYATSNLQTVIKSLKEIKVDNTVDGNSVSCSSSIDSKPKPVPPLRPKKLETYGRKVSPYSVSPLARPGTSFITVENECYESSTNTKPGCIDDSAMGSCKSVQDHKALRRSFSDEHIYSEPYEAPPSGVKLNKTAVIEKTSPRDHHYMHIPVITHLETRHSKLHRRDSSARDAASVTPKTNESDSPKPKKLLGPTIRDMINQSFSLLRCHLNRTDSLTESAKQDDKDDSGSEVSVRDVEERIIYVNSVKKKRISNSAEELKSSNHLFKLLILANLGGECGKEPQAILRFPKLQPSESDWAIIEHLCFPDFENCTITDPAGRESMLFILCDEKGEKTYGHCLRFYKSKKMLQSHKATSLCLLSSIYAPSFYFQVLDELCSNIDAVEANWTKIISDLYAIRHPSPGACIYLPLQNHSKNELKVIRPADLQLENAPVTRLLQLLDVELLLKIVSSLLLERRVLLLSSSFLTLSQCCRAILFLLYPFTWQHMVIPILPECLLSESCTLSPYLMGIFSHWSEKLCEMIEDQLLIIDVDRGCSLREVGDENTILPGKIQRALETALNLAKNMTDPTETLRDIMISEAFVRMFVETVGHYGDFIVQKSNKAQTFQKEAFCKFPSSQSIQVFLQWFTETQMFEAFISDCLHKKQHLLVLEEWKVLPLHSQLESCLFDRRAFEYKEAMQGMPGIKNNLKEFGMKVRNFGMRLKKALELE